MIGFGQPVWTDKSWKRLPGFVEPVFKNIVFSLIIRVALQSSLMCLNKIREFEFTGPTTRPTTTLPVDPRDGSSEVFSASLCMSHIHFPCLFERISCLNQCRSLFLTVLIISWQDQSAHKPKAPKPLCYVNIRHCYLFFLSKCNKTASLALPRARVVALTWSCRDKTGLFLVVLMCRTWKWFLAQRS